MSAKNPVLRVSIIARPSSMKVKKRMFAVFIRKNYPKGRQYLPLLWASFDRICRAMEPHKDKRAFYTTAALDRHPPALVVTWRLHE